MTSISIDLNKYQKSKMVVIPANEKSKQKWDIDESGSPIVNINEPEKCNTAELILLYKILEYIYILKEELFENLEYCQYCNCWNEAVIFIRTPCTVQEIPFGTPYEGINKPKRIVQSSGDNKEQEIKQTQKEIKETQQEIKETQKRRCGNKYRNNYFHLLL
jgi:hypothetical protein